MAWLAWEYMAETVRRGQGQGDVRAAGHDRRDAGQPLRRSSRRQQRSRRSCTCPRRRSSRPSRRGPRARSTPPESAAAVGQGTDATPGGRNRRPVTRSDTPVRSRYGVMPPFQNAPPAAEQHAQVDVLRLRDDAVVEHQPDLLGQRDPGAVEHLVGGLRAVPARPQAPRPRGRRRACRPPRRRRRSCRRRPAPGTRARRRTGRGTPRAASAPCAARRPDRPAASSTSGDIGSPSGSSAASATSNGVPSSMAAMTSPSAPGDQPVEDERRRVLDQHAGLLELLADGERRGQRRVVGPLRRARPRAAAARRPG